MKRKQQLIANTALLTATTLLLRAMGVSFQAYLANRIGGAGMGLFSLVMSVYHFGVTFACSGVGLASTRLVSEELATGNEGGVRAAVTRALVYGLLFGGMASTLIFFGAPFAGEMFLGDSRTVMPLRILSVSLPCVAMSSALGGYFSAVRRVGKNAAVQLAEQGIRITLCVWLLSGTKNDAGDACIAVVSAGSVAEIASFLLLFFIYLTDAGRYKRKMKDSHLTKRLLAISLPVAVSSYVRSGLSTLEHAFIPRGLMMYGGNSETALSLYGTVHGMVLPLILFPAAALQAFATILIPEVTRYHKRGDRDAINNLISRSLSLTMTFSVGAAGLLFFFAHEIGMAVYNSREAAHFIRIIAPLAVVMYADGVVDAVLKGLNQQVYSMGYNIVDSALAVVLMLFLLPAKGIDGYVMIIYITESVNAFLSITRLLYVADFKLRPLAWALVPALCVTACSLLSRSLFSGVFSILPALLLYSILMLLFSGKTGSCKKLSYMIQ